MRSHFNKHLKCVRISVHHLVEIMHAFRKVTTTRYFLIINNFKKNKNDITVQKSFRGRHSKRSSFGRDNTCTHQKSDTIR